MYKVYELTTIMAELEDQKDKKSLKEFDTEAEAMEYVNECIEENNSLLIACADGALNITQIQRQGKKLMSIGELLRGFHFAENSKAE